jgi:hypothetical protein
MEQTMKGIQKKQQVINEYFNEILPFIQYKNINNNYQYECTVKFGSTEHINSQSIKEYIDYTPLESNAFLLDFQNSSIKDAYRGLNKIHKVILEG